MKLEEPVWLYTTTNRKGDKLLGEFQSSIFDRKGWMLDNNEQVYFTSLIKWRDAINKRYGETNVRLNMKRKD